MDTFFWLVGLLEGEGSFLRGMPSRPNRPIIKLEMKDEDVVAKAAALMGAPSYAKSMAKARKNPKWSPTFRFMLKGPRAVDWMQRLQPHMGERRQAQIEAALASRKDYSSEPCMKRFVWPSDAEILRVRRESGWRPAAKKLGVSFMALRRKVARIEKNTMVAVAKR